MVRKRRDAGAAGGDQSPAVGDGVIGALCAFAGVCANEVLGLRAYADRYVVVVADGRKLQVPAATIFEYTIQAALDDIPIGGAQ